MYIVCTKGIFNPEKSHILFKSNSVKEIKKYVKLLLDTSLTKLEYVEVYKQIKIKKR
jgi:hypothetical protein